MGYQNPTNPNFQEGRNCIVGVEFDNTGAIKKVTGVWENLSDYFKWEEKQENPKRFDYHQFVVNKNNRLL